MPVVYLIDERIKSPRALLAEIPSVDFGFVIGSFVRVSEIVQDVMARLSKYEAPAGSGARAGFERPIAPLISELRILAHGDARELALGRGLDLANVAQLGPLAALMRGGCFLLGCDITSGTFRQERFLGGWSTDQRIGSPFHDWGYDSSQLQDGAGYPLLGRLAQVLSVSVTAGLNSQNAPRDWQFHGTTITVDPFGKVTFSGMDLDDPSCRGF